MVRYTEDDEGNIRLDESSDWLEAVNNFLGCKISEKKAKEWIVERRKCFIFFETREEISEKTR